jgi:cysteine desulfurase/selenocysteine lyase
VLSIIKNSLDFIYNRGRIYFSMSEIDGSEQIRQDFPVTRKIIYMNNGAIAPMPLSTIKTMTDFNIRCCEQGPDATETADYITSLLNELRTRVAHLINCEREEVTLTQSTTQGLNIVATGIDWRAGDTIVVRGGRHEHFANYLPWLWVSQRKGVSLRELAIDTNGYFDFADAERAIKGAKLITMSHALYNTGAIMPLDQVGKIANENNALFCVDAAQSAGTIDIDVKKIGCDFMAFPGFKWLCGPTGIGVFYCAKHISEMLTPQAIGSESSALSDKNILTYLDMPLKFQAGFRNFSGAAGLEASLRYILRMGLENIRSLNMKVAAILREEIGRIPGCKIYGPEDPEKRTSIITFTLPAADSSDIVKRLEQNGMIFAARDIGNGKKAIRAAPHFFNSEDEASQAAGYMKNLIR